MNMVGNEYIDNDTLKKLLEYEETKKLGKTEPVVNRVEEMEKLVGRCVKYIDGVQEFFNMKMYVTEKQLYVLREMGRAITATENEKVEVLVGTAEVKPVIRSVVGVQVTAGRKESDKVLLERIFAKNPTSSFVKSVITFYNKNGRITDKQYDALIRTFESKVANGKSASEMVDTESVEYKETEMFLMKCERSFPDSRFVLSVKDQFLVKGYITDKQKAALLKTLTEAENKIVVDEIKVSDEVVVNEVIADEVIVDNNEVKE
jgi:hypothetical protein